MLGILMSGLTRPYPAITLNVDRHVLRATSAPENISSVSPDISAKSNS